MSKEETADSSLILLGNEQYATVHNALGIIARGYFINKNGNRQRISREKMIDAARSAFRAMGGDWQTFKENNE